MDIQATGAAGKMASCTTTFKRSASGVAEAAVASTSDVYAGERASKAAEIMAGKDLRNISRNELKSLTDQLYDAGVITSEQRLDLNMPNLDELNKQMGCPYSGPEEKKDFLAEVGNWLDSAKRLRPGDRASISCLEKVNNMAQSLDALS